MPESRGQKEMGAGAMRGQKKKQKIRGIGPAGLGNVVGQEPKRRRGTVSAPPNLVRIGCKISGSGRRRKKVLVEDH